MSFSLYALLEAKKFSQLPKMLQDIITDNQERQDDFQERFLDYDEKDRWVCIKSAMTTCLERGMFQERAFYHVLFQQEVRDETIDDDWEDMIMENCEEHDTQQVNCGTQTEPIAIQTEEPAQEVSVPTVEPVERQVRKKYNHDSTYRCACCHLNLSSTGAIHNHYKSKLHTKGVRKMLTAMRERVLVGDKMIVNVRNKARDPDLSWEIEDDIELDETFKAVEKYLEKGHDENPITDIFLRRKNTQVLSTGQERITWKPIIILNP